MVNWSHHLSKMDSADDVECSLSSLDSMTVGSMVQNQITDGSYVTIKANAFALNSSVYEFNVYSKDDFTIYVNRK